MGGGLATVCSAEWALLESTEESAGESLAKNLGHGVEVPDGLIDEVREVDFPNADDEADHPFRDGPQRAAAYLVAAKRVAVRGLRYVAYSSDIGESLRPVRVRGEERAEGGGWEGRGDCDAVALLVSLLKSPLSTQLPHAHSPIHTLTHTHTHVCTHTNHPLNCSYCFSPTLSLCPLPRSPLPVGPVRKYGSGNVRHRMDVCPRRRVVQRVSKAAGGGEQCGHCVDHGARSYIPGERGIQFKSLTKHICTLTTEMPHATWKPWT